MASTTEYRNMLSQPSMQCCSFLNIWREEVQNVGMPTRNLAFLSSHTVSQQDVDSRV